MPITVQTAAQNSRSLVFLAVTPRTDRVSEQIHVVRSLISDDPSVVNSVDVVCRATNPDMTPIHFVVYRMAGPPYIGLRSPVHLISRSTSSSRRQRWIKSTEVDGLRST